MVDDQLVRLINGILRVITHHHAFPAGFHQLGIRLSTTVLSFVFIDQRLQLILKLCLVGFLKPISDRFNKSTKASMTRTG
ncbi:hypothetical protein [Marinobacter sp.]|uniref:hypothetical protein n=1 Tax=Marinobacter sp. TaxID=50741 RepID=UPI003562A1D0